MFQTVLIANRGEIACRIISTLRRLGVRSVAVYSDADAGARHVALADTAVRIGPAPATQSYLSIEAVIAAAIETGAQAIHPGYGFLAENAAFARACERAGIVFIGPSSEAIEVMGDKISAKTAVEARGVPTVPGIARPGLTDDDLIAAAPAIGYPLLIKPSAGGGGKGMHVVTEASALPAALAAARREAAASFGDDALFIERYLSTPRHIEVQVLADGHGNVIHLGERECSLQRRHQKVIEEAPSPLLDEATRAAIGEAACETARSVDYRGAGTVEFIVEAARPGEFFFMEMNTRLQVEHPVTEEVTGVDLVEQQLRIAAGQPLALAQADVRLRGHSIEARVYAEDPAAGFLPTGGHVAYVAHPSGAHVRVDTAIATGLDVGVDYDPMLAKIITWGENREAARRALVRALDETVVVGFPTNIEFMRALLELPEVVAGNLDTDLIARVQDSIEYAAPGEREFTEAALLLDAALAGRPGVAGAAAREDTGSSVDEDAGAHAGTPAFALPWSRRNGWRLGAFAPRRYRLVCGGETRELSVGGTVGSGTDSDGTTGTGTDGVEPQGAQRFRTVVGGVSRTVTAVVGGVGGSEGFGGAAGAGGPSGLGGDGAAAGARVSIARDGSVFEFTVARPNHGDAAEESADPRLESPMPGTVVLVPAGDGAHVEVGDPIIVVEAMKMEHVLRANVAGTVALKAAAGEQVSRGQVLAVIQADSVDSADAA